MDALRWFAVTLLLGACTEPTQPGEFKPKGRGTVVVDSLPCDAILTQYKLKQAKFNHCEADNDCAEIWPGLCPHGPYYVNKSADVPQLVQLESAVEQQCEVPECEPPPQLGMALCLEGTCRPGRTPPSDPTCWDTPVEYVEFGQRRTLNARHALKGPTPLTGIGVPAKGELKLEVRWQDCDGCILQLSEHNLGMSRLVEGRRTVVGELQTIVLEATPGPYYLFAKGRGGLEVVANISPAATADRHGEVHYRVCED